MSLESMGSNNLFRHNSGVNYPYNFGSLSITYQHLHHHLIIIIIITILK